MSTLLRLKTMQKKFTLKEDGNIKLAQLNRSTSDYKKAREMKIMNL